MTSVSFEKGHPSNSEHMGLTRKGQTSGQNREEKKRNIGPQQKYKIFCIKFYYHSTGKKAFCDFTV